jgi:hypothetical protein
MLANVHSLLSCGLALLTFAATANAGKSESLSTRRVPQLPTQRWHDGVDWFAAAPDGVFDGDKAVAKIDYSPPFLFPQGGEVWTAGQRYSASW